MRFPARPFIYPITDRELAGGRPAGEIVAELCAAGARIIQLREKGLATRRLRELALEAVAAVRAAGEGGGGGAMLLVNDRPDVALYAGADGVHLGDRDMPPEAARRVLGPEAIIGVSCHSAEDVRAADALPVDYIAVGPVYPTETKRPRFPVVGTELVRRARALTRKPLVAIGGIGRDNAAAVAAAGADGVAVIGAVMVPGEIEARARELSAALGRD